MFPRCRFTSSLIFAFATTAFVATGSVVRAAPNAAPTERPRASVETYHDDALRTGWNANEPTLTTSNVNASSFGVLATVPLDGEVNAAPLVLASENFTGGSAPGVYDIVYVATENNTVYAITTAGKILAHRSLGMPVPRSELPNACGNNGPTIGITSTPVIDRGTHMLYVIADTYANGLVTYHLHALDTRTLEDALPPVGIVGKHVLSNGRNTYMVPSVVRQRAALLEANGTIYAGFGSYCDQDRDEARGWVLGWQASTLAPLASPELTDTFWTSPKDEFLDSIWMSGAGLAADPTGNIYFVTSNSDPSTYDGVHDIQESVVRESGDLSTIQSLFTPSDQPELDARDDEIGAGGVLLLPYVAGGSLHDLATAAGKDGSLYLLDRDSLGGHSPTTNNVLGTYSVGSCWCAQSYYVGPDGIGRVVTSGGNQIGIWQLQTTPTVALVRQSHSTSIATGQDQGFFTTVSSNGTAPGSAVVWAVSRPTDRDPANVSLYAFDPATATFLYSAVAGTWPYVGGDADIVPVVANGDVFVASYAQLAIFGELPAGAGSAAIGHPAAPERDVPLPGGTHEMYGRIAYIRGTQIDLALRNGRTARIDVSSAERAFATVDLYVGEAVMVRFASGARNAFAVKTVQRAKDSPALWGPDR